MSQGPEASRDRSEETSGRQVLRTRWLIPALAVGLLAWALAPEPGAVQADLARSLETAKEFLAREENPATEQALEIFEDLASMARFRGDLELQTRALLGVGRARLQLGKPRPARVSLELALALEPAGEHPELAVELLNEKTLALRLLGKPERARETGERALRLASSHGDLRGECEALNHLGVLARRRHDLVGAWNFYSRALEGWQALEDPVGQATVSHNLGVLLTELDLLPEAIDAFRQAAEIHQREGNTRFLGQTLTALGWAYHWGPEPELALPIYERALEAHRAIEDARGEAVVLDRRASTLRKLDRPEILDARREALALFRASGELSGVAAILCNLGQDLIAQDRHREAIAPLEESRRLFEELGNLSSEAEALYHRARAESAQGDSVAAARSFELAIRRLESRDLADLSSRIRVSYLSTLQKVYGHYLDFLIEEFSKTPSPQLAEEILAVGERQRARGLLFDLSNSDLLAREQRDRLLSAQIQDLESHRLLEPPPQQGTFLEQQRTLLLEADRARSMARPAHSAELAGIPQPLDLEGIQNQVLDDDTVALVYGLGTERSFLTVVTQDTLHGFELESRAELEAATTRVLEHLAKSWNERGARAAEIHGAELARGLLAPVELLDGSRLVIVGDGQLQRLPFGALPHPSTRLVGEPLIAHFEVLQAPSLSSVAALRARSRDRPRPAKTLAAFADPVFSHADPRLRSGEPREPPHPSGATEHPVTRAERALPRFERLEHSGREIEAILDLAPDSRTLAQTGFEATRQAVLSADLAKYQVLHFATHAMIHPEQPELTALVMSQLDASGEAIEGFLFTRDLVEVDVAADLVVLSACRTGGGTLLRGEGIVGLARGFFHAGATRVLVSHWRVEDEATAELMTRFYRKRWGEGLSDGAALRAAQLSMSREQRWALPYYWAGFSLQGDWVTGD